MTGSR